MVTRVRAPEVSVVIIFLDAGAFLAEAVESVIAQSFGDWELILVDDGSSDESTATALRYAGLDPGRIFYLEHARHANRGMSASRNVGLAHARGNLVAFLDADDYWVPQKLAEQVAIMRAEPRAELVFGDTKYWHGWTGKPDNMARDRLWQFEAEPGVVIPPPGLLFVAHFGRSLTPSMSSILVRADALRAIGGFEERFTGLCEDLVFTAKAFLKLNVYRCDSCWDWYRQHARSCCALADRQGEVEAHHWRFYLWMKQYFHCEKVEERRLLRALDRAILRVTHPRLARVMRRLMPAT